MTPSLKIAPSILSADFGKLNAEIASVDEHVDFIHVDVMDAHFVPNLTLGAPIVRCLKSRVPIECHLMISNPEDYVEAFAKAGASMITIHWEATKGKTADVLKQIRDLGVKPSLSLNPPTDVAEIEPYLDLVDMVLVMSVNPGFGGQSFIGDVLTKVTRIRELKPELDICMDGGIKADTGQEALDAGANALVAGSYIFKSEDRLGAINSLRQLKMSI
ncbi:MAG: ribulose-phosphate 3-epimerase [Candidatus Peregrinibacteria bacterium]|nr:ribulose-phosphate 3-epimerase [Candidatus Peregrinibacteria bacterium]